MSDTDMNPLENNQNGENNAPSIDTQPSSSKSSKKKKNKRKGKKGTVLPSLVSVEKHLLWNTRYSSNFGRHAVAKQPIAQGQRVLVEEAVVAVPRERFSNVLCHQCFKHVSDFGSLEPIEGVPTAYCSVECYQASLVSDSEMAVIFEELNDLAAASHCDVELLNLIVQLEDAKRKAEQKELVDKYETNEDVWWLLEEENDSAMKTGWADVQGLLKHWDKKKEEWKACVTEACLTLRDRLKKIPRFADVELQELQQLAATVNANSHGLGLAGVKNTDMALGLFPALSMFNHSCVPNCCFSGTGRVMTVRALKNIESGEQLTVSYANLMEPRRIRQHYLQEMHHFTCSCQRCASDILTSADRFLEGVKCLTPKCQGLMIESWDDDQGIGKWTCEVCKRSATSEYRPSTHQPSLRHGHHQHHEHDEHCHCCQGDHHHHEDESTQNTYDASEEDNVDETPLDPGAIVKKAEESLAKALETCSKRQLPNAIRLLEKHVTTYEAKLSPYHVCVFDALTPLLNCHRHMDDFNSAITVCQRILQTFAKVLTTCSIEQSNFQEVLGELYKQKMHLSHSSTKSTVVRNLMKKQAQEAYRKCMAIRVICCGPNHASVNEARTALRAL